VGKTGANTDTGKKGQEKGIIRTFSKGAHGRAIGVKRKKTDDRKSANKGQKKFQRTFLRKEAKGMLGQQM